MAKEILNIEVHQQMAFNTIYDQAGTLSKACLEGVMNTVDAGGSEIRIQIEPEVVTMQDDGRGFTSAKEVQKYFATLGQPHGKEEVKIFGKFRMGRGQMWAFGANKWKSNEFRMDVDVKRNGLKIEFEELSKKEIAPGCGIHIDLYDPLLPSEMTSTIKDLHLWCKWTPVNVYVNDKLVSQNPAEAKWDHEIDEAYIRLKASGGVVVYNQGVFVMEMHNHRFGTGGEIVTKMGKDLGVNYARNDIKSVCPIWKKIAPFVNRKATEKNTGKKSLTDGSRQRLVDQILEGVKLEKPEKLRLITTVTGRHYAIDSLRHLHGYSKFSVAPLGNRLGDSLMKQKIAFVIAQETLDRFGVSTGPELYALLKKRFGRPGDGSYSTKGFVEFSKLTKGMDANFVTVDEKDATLNERVWLRLIRECAPNNIRVEGKYPYARWNGGRRIVLGSSKAADGWTDGSSYVVVGKEFLKGMPYSVSGFVYVANLLLHEACHDDLDTNDHDHTQEFYEKFHDSVNYIGHFTQDCVKALPSIMEKEGKKMPKSALGGQDRLFKMEQASDKHQAIAAKTADDEDEIPEDGEEFDDIEQYLK
jgi:hypothetical protein